MQSPQPMIIIIKWRRDLEALFLPATDHDQMDKRYGWGSDFLLFLANHDYSSVMECYAIKLLFIGPCLCWTGHYHIHRPLLEDWGTSGHYVGTHQEHCWYLLYETGQTNSRWQTFGKFGRKGKIKKELFVNGDIVSLLLKFHFNYDV